MVPYSTVKSQNNPLSSVVRVTRPAYACAPLSDFLAIVGLTHTTPHSLSHDKYFRPIVMHEFFRALAHVKYNNEECARPMNI